jgi:hypothetical protein
MAGRSFTTDSTVSDVDPGVSYRFAGSGTSGDIRGSRTVRADQGGGGSVFTYQIDLEPKGVTRAEGPETAQGAAREGLSSGGHQTLE